MRSRYFKPAELEQTFRDRGLSGIADYVQALVRKSKRKRYGMLSEAGSSSIVSPELRAHLPELLEKMDAQFGIRTSFFYMGRGEWRDEEHPEIIRRGGLNVLEWLSLASKLKDVSPEAIRALDTLCTEFARIDKLTSRLGFRLKYDTHEVYLNLRRKLGWRVTDSMLLSKTWW